MKMALHILTAVYLLTLTGCVQYASGYKKTGGGGASADGEAAGGDESGGDAACLKLAEKRKNHLKMKLQDEETEEPPAEELGEETPPDETASCEPVEEGGEDLGEEEPVE